MSHITRSFGIFFEFLSVNSKISSANELARPKQTERKGENRRKLDFAPFFKRRDLRLEER